MATPLQFRLTRGDSRNDAGYFNIANSIRTDVLVDERQDCLVGRTHHRIRHRIWDDGCNRVLSHPQHHSPTLATTMGLYSRARPDTSMFATFAIPAAALGGLIWCGLLLLLLDVAFGVKFDRERRLTLVGVAIVATYIGYLIAIGYNLVRDARKR